MNSKIIDVDVSVRRLQSLANQMSTKQIVVFISMLFNQAIAFVKMSFFVIVNYQKNFKIVSAQGKQFCFLTIQIQTQFDLDAFAITKFEIRRQ